MKPDERGALGYRSTIRDKIIGIVVVLLIVPLLTNLCYYKVLSPFSLSESAFALFFPLLEICCILSYILLEVKKSVALYPGLIAAFPVNASLYQIVYFLFGKNRVVQTAIVDLIRRELLVATNDKLFLVYKERYVQAEYEQNPLIPALLKEERTCITYSSIVYEWHNTHSIEHPVLQQLLIQADSKGILPGNYSLLVLPLLVGVVRFVQCLGNGFDPDPVLWEVLMLTAGCWLLVKYVCCSSLVRLKAKLLVSKQRDEVLYPHNIVSRFAFEGADAIERYSDGPELIALFNLSPVIDRVSNGIVTFLEYCSEKED